MYTLPFFKEKDAALVLEFIHQHPFAFLVGCDDARRPVATQIPVFIEERGEKLFLSGHLMRNTDHHKAFEQHPQVLCVFTGAHSYVSATWYPNPHQASTWNYMSVHARGSIRFLGEESLIEVLKKTSLHFERGNKEAATVYDNLAEDYRSRLLKAIVAFEVEVESLDHVFKLSQNKDNETYDSIVQHLSKEGGEAAAVAEEMKKRSAKMFPAENAAQNLP